MNPQPKRQKIKIEDRDEYRKFMFAVFELDDWKCVVCLQHKPLSAHHIIKRSDIRLDTTDNAVSVCNKCHDLAEKHKIDMAVDSERRITITRRG